MNKTIYPGSFDPFTNGHLDIVRKAANLFDEVCILVSYNGNKTKRFNPSDMKLAIDEVIKEEGLLNCKVDINYGFVVDYAKENGFSYIVRGIRNNTDYNYEEVIAQVNKELTPLVETIYMRANEPVISSTVISELFYAGKDISKYVPKQVNQVMRKRAKELSK